VDSDSEQTLDYGLSSTYATGPARFTLGVQGRWVASSDEGDFGDNSVHQLGAAADFLFRGVRPGVSLRIPLEDSVESAGNSFGIFLQVPLR
jgi:hypothetical protein